MENPMYFGAPPDVFHKAKQLRIYETEAENILWSKLCDNQVLNLHFRRQHPINRFIADFYCVKLKLVIEVDGSIHDLPENKAYDIIRSEILNSFGITVLRFSNEQIIYEVDDAIKKIKEVAIQLVSEA
jgi:very-short-patch-repair endonuclease